MIIKTKENPIGSFSLGAITEKEFNSTEELLNQFPEVSDALPGIGELNTLENSTLVTDSHALKTTDTGIAASPAGVLELITREIMTRSAPLRVETHSYVMTPMGVTQTIGADGSGLNVVARVGITLPTTKLRKFADLDQQIYDNMGMVSARQIEMANSLTTKPERLAYMVCVNSILGFYQANLNRVAANLSYIKNIGPLIGMEDTSKYLINDESVQRTLGELVIAIKDLPIIDPEYHDRINVMSKYYAAKSKSVGIPCVRMPNLALGTTSATLDLDGATSHELFPIENTDTYWCTDLISLSLTDTSLFGIDRLFTADYLSGALFYSSYDATQIAAIKAILSKMVLHVNSLRAKYTNYFQYIRFAMSKGWIQLDTLGKFLSWTISETGDLAVTLPEIEFSYAMDVLYNYAPNVMQAEGTGNNAWGRVHAPLLIASTGTTYGSASALAMMCKYVGEKKLHDKCETLDELASWGVWLGFNDESTASETVLEGNAFTFVNPYDGLTCINCIAVVIIAANGACSYGLGNYPLIWNRENVSRLNYAPIILNEDGNYTYVSVTDIIENSAAELLLHIGVQEWVDMNTIRGGLLRRIRMATTNVGTVNYAFWFVSHVDGVFLTQIDALEFIRACTQYFSSKPLPVIPVKSKLN